MTVAAPTGESAPPPLPRARTDLDVELVADAATGFPAAIIRDPLRGAYFRLAWPESGLFLAWQEATNVPQLLTVFRHRFGGVADPGDVRALVEFAIGNELTQADQASAWNRLAVTHARSRRGFASLLLHNYLFFRIPILRPERHLKKLLPLLGFAYTRGFWLLVLAVWLLGAYLATRQWSSVVEELRSSLELQALAIYGGAVLALKAVHELGHALTTVRFGCRVPTVGVAIILGMPVLYTDTTDSWRLARRSERLAIVFAGVAAEAIIAAVALLLWSFLDDGLPRRICFAFATASLALSLVVNLNPLMRFDGYFALSDALGVPNLQGRSFALGVWRLRELLFGLDKPPPEAFPPRLQTTLIHYAAAVAVYRTMLFLGIAAALYLAAGKAIGIVLGGIEIGIFIVMPIVKELSMWWKLRVEIRRGRRVRWMAAAVVLAGVAFFTPWITSVPVPAVVVAEQEERVHLPFAARLQAVKITDGQAVRRGDVLFVADSADLQRQQLRAAVRERTLEIQLSRLTASSAEREVRLVLLARRDQVREEQQSIHRRLQQLEVRAPFDGRISDLDPELASGVWVNEKQQLALVVASGRSRARGMLAEAELQRVRVGAKATFIADDAARPKIAMAVDAIMPASDDRFSEPVLADRHGGSVLAGIAGRDLVVRHGYFEVAFGDFAGERRQIVRGVARIDADPTSPAHLVWQALARVLAREQGF